MDRKAATWLRRSFVLLLIASLYEVLINGMGYWIALSIIRPELVGGTRRASKPRDVTQLIDEFFSIQSEAQTVWNSNLFNDQTGDISMMHYSPTTCYTTYSITSASTVVANQSSAQQCDEMENGTCHEHDLQVNSDDDDTEDEYDDDENPVDRDEGLEQLNANVLLNFEPFNSDDGENESNNGNGDESDLNRSYTVATRTHSTVQQMGDGIQGVSGLMFSITWGAESDSDDDSLETTPDTEEYDLTIETRSFVRYNDGRAILTSRTGIYGHGTNNDGESSNLLMATPVVSFSQPMDLATTERLAYNISSTYSTVVQIMIMAIFLHLINRS